MSTELLSGPGATILDKEDCSPMRVAQEVIKVCQNFTRATYLRLQFLDEYMVAILLTCLAPIYSRLRSVNLYVNPTGGRIVGNLHTINNAIMAMAHPLRSIDTTNFPMTGEGLAHLARLNSLQYVRLMSGAGLPFLRNCQLVALELYAPVVSMIDVLAALQSSHSSIRKLVLAEIKLQGNGFNRLSDEEAKERVIEQVKKFSDSLKFINLNNCTWVDKDILWALEGAESIFCVGCGIAQSVADDLLKSSQKTTTCFVDF